MKDFENKLNKWALNAVDFCHSIAIDKNEDFDLAFYAFQNSPIENPEILFLGINPGGEAYNYASQYKNPIWNLLNDEKMTPERFVKANPMVDEMENWKMWKNVERTFYTDNLQTLYKRSMKMNLVYFNTPNISNFLNRKNGVRTFKKNRDLSLDLILNVIKPKSIICLGTVQCFDYLPLINKETLLNGKKRLVVKGNLENIPVYGIPHPSGSYTSNFDLEKISSLLDKHL